MRVLHFSDIHISLGLREIPLFDWPGKRVAGGVNFLRGRGRRFEGALRKLGRLAEFAAEDDLDLVIFSGDFTAMGTNAEFAAAREAMQPFLDSGAEFVCVPGNHDLYTRRVVRRRRFEKHFGDLLLSDMEDRQVDGPWPTVRLLGDDVAVIGLNSARPNPVPWKSSGRIPDVQLAQLRAIAALPELADRFVFVVTHYAPRLADGRPDTRLHGLDNADEFLDASAGIERGAILCGHVHRTYRVRVPNVGPEIFCAGSATMHELEGFWILETEPASLQATRGHWTGDDYDLHVSVG